MAKLERIKEAIKSEFEKQQPRADMELVKQALMDWLAQMKLPACSTAGSWEDCLMVFDDKPGEELPDEGLKIRLALRLFTRENSYLIAIMECLGRGARGVLLLSTHVNWKEDERMAQKAIEEKYVGQFTDMPRAKHIIWAQTIQEQELHEAMNAAAIAILGHELVGERPSTGGEADLLSHPISSAAAFPRQDDD